jgi:hypothetical protein
MRSSQSESKQHSEPMSTIVKVEMAMGAAIISAIVIFSVGFFSSAIYSLVSARLNADSYNADVNIGYISPSSKIVLILMPASFVLLTAIIGLYFLLRDKKRS